MEAEFTRQDRLIGQEQLAFPVTIVGAGGIGSPTALALAKMGCRDITVYDPDTVEAHNVPNQLYRPDDIGRPKVDALADFVRYQTGTAITARCGLAPLRAYRGVVIAAVDSMAARAELWRKAIRLEPSTDLLIDARMGGETGRIYSIRPVDPDDIALYEGTLYLDSDCDPDPCSQQAVIYTTFFMAGLLASQVRRWAVGAQLDGELIFDLATTTLMSSRPRVESR